MKSIIGFLVIIPWLYLSAYGQPGNYRLVTSDYMFFESKELMDLWCGSPYGGDEVYFVFGARIESTDIISEGNKYIFNREIAPDKFGFGWCIGPSLLGDSLLEGDDGISTIFMENSPEIHIDRALSPGESNIFSLFENGKYSICTVITHEPESFLDITDSVKTYELQMYDSLDNPLDDPSNGLTFKLSRSHGLIEMFHFREVQDRDFGYPGFILVSSSQLRPDTLFFTRRDIFDFEVGDEFHYRIQNEYNGPGADEYAVRRIMEKVVSPGEDSISYLIEELNWGTKIVIVNGPDPYEWQDFRIERTLDVTYTDLDQKFISPDVMPFEPVVVDNNSSDTVYSNALIYRNPDFYNNRYIIQVPGLEKPFVNGCFHPFEPEYRYDSYIVGAGILVTREEIFTTTPECAPCESLIYYKKGSETWGEPVGLNESKNKFTARVFPNPASTNLVIEFEDEELQTVQLVIYNSLGQQVQSVSNISSNRVEINLEGYSPGLYYFGLTGQGMTKGSRGRFVVR